MKFVLILLLTDNENWPTCTGTVQCNLFLVLVCIIAGFNSGFLSGGGWDVGEDYISTSRIKYMYRAH